MNPPAELAPAADALRAAGFVVLHPDRISAALAANTGRLCDLERARLTLADVAGKLRQDRPGWAAALDEARDTVAAVVADVLAARLMLLDTHTLDPALAAVARDGAARRKQAGEMRKGFRVVEGGANCEQG